MRLKSEWEGLSGSSGSLDRPRPPEGDLDLDRHLEIMICGQACLDRHLEIRLVPRPSFRDQVCGQF